MDNNQMLNILCKEFTRPETLNTLHACRDGHPLGMDDPWKWRNAWSVVAQQHVYGVGREFHKAKDWLKKQADKEWES